MTLRAEVKQLREVMKLRGPNPNPNLNPNPNPSPNTLTLTKAKRKEQWEAELRKKSGVDGFAVLYEILELPPRRLATISPLDLP